MIFGHSFVDLPMIFNRDFVTHENHLKITSLVTKKLLFILTDVLFYNYPNQISKPPVYTGII